MKGKKKRERERREISADRIPELFQAVDSPGSRREKYQFRSRVNWVDAIDKRFPARIHISEFEENIKEVEDSEFAEHCRGIEKRSRAFGLFTGKTLDDLDIFPLRKLSKECSRNRVRRLLRKKIRSRS